MHIPREAVVGKRVRQLSVELSRQVFFWLSLNFVWFRLLFEAKRCILYVVAVLVTLWLFRLTKAWKALLGLELHSAVRRVRDRHSLPPVHSCRYSRWLGLFRRLVFAINRPVTVN